MSLNLGFPLYKIYDTYRDAHYALIKDLGDVFAGLGPVMKTFNVDIGQYKPSEPAQMAPFPDVLNAIAATSSSRFSSMIKKFDDLSLIKDMIAEIRAASKSRETKMQHTIQLQRDAPVISSEPDLKKANAQQLCGSSLKASTNMRVHALVEQKQTELEEEMRSRIEVFVIKEQELQGKIEDMETEIKRLEQRNLELEQQLKKEAAAEHSLRVKEAGLAAEYEAKIKGLEHDLRNLQKEKYIYESDFATRKAECEDEIYKVKKALSSVRNEMEAATKAKTRLESEISGVQEQKQKNAIEITRLAQSISEAAPIIDHDIQKLNYVSANRDEMISSALHELLKNSSRVESCGFEGNNTFSMPLTENLQGVGECKDATHGERCLALNQLNKQAPKQKDKEDSADGGGSKENARETSSTKTISKGGTKAVYQIPTEYVSDLSGSQVPVADWAMDELLSKCISHSAKINPDTVFQQPQQRITVYDLFGISNHPYDNRARQTQNWAMDKLSQREIDTYNLKMGFTAQKQHQIHHK